MRLPWALHPQTTARSRSWFPLGGLTRVLTDPEKFAAALRGELSREDLARDLASVGITTPAEPLPARTVAVAVPVATNTVVDTVTNTVTNTVDDFSHNAEVTVERTIPGENPFRPGGPLQASTQPYGRAEILDRLEACITGSMPCVLRGARRSGKSWLLAALNSRQSKDQRLVISSTLESWQGSTRDELAAHLAATLEPNLKNSDHPAETLQALLQNGVQAGQRPLLLIDEIVHLKHADRDVFAWLRSLGQTCAGIVMAGSHHDWHQVVQRALQFAGSSFGNDVSAIDLKPLSPELSARFLMETRPPDVPFDETTVVAWTVKRCDGWPFYLQVLGHELVQEVRAGRRGALVEEDELDELFDAALIEGWDAVFRSRWADIPATAQGVLRNVRHGRPPVFKELSPTQRRAVQACGLCSSRGTWLQDRPFLQWIERHRDDLFDRTEAGGEP